MKNIYQNNCFGAACFLVLSSLQYEGLAAAATCGLVGIPRDTSPENLFTIFPIADTLQSNVKAWEHPTYGGIYRTTVNAKSHFQYLAATFSYKEEKYYLLGNDRTSTFVREERRRDMQRFITVYCNDGSFTRYFLQIPLFDETAPQFEKPQYVFNITSNWNRDLPINGHQPVIIGDDAFELENSTLSYEFIGLALGGGKLIIKQERMLPSGPNPEWFYFRLYFFLSEEEAILMPGKQTLVLFAVDGNNNISFTVIVLNVK